VRERGREMAGGRSDRGTNSSGELQKGR
jgi:hypothetical protein